MASPPSHSQSISSRSSDWSTKLVTTPTPRAARTVTSTWPKKMYWLDEIVGASVSLLMEKTAPRPLSYLRLVPSAGLKKALAPLVKSISTGLAPTALGISQSSTQDTSSAQPLLIHQSISATPAELRGDSRLTTLGGVASSEGLRRGQRGRKGHGEDLGEHCCCCSLGGVWLSVGGGCHEEVGVEVDRSAWSGICGLVKVVDSIGGPKKRVSGVYQRL